MSWIACHRLSCKHEPWEVKELNWFEEQSPVFHVNKSHKVTSSLHGAGGGVLKTFQSQQTRLW